MNNLKNIITGPPGRRKAKLSAGLKPTVISKFRSFCKISTLHGFYYLYKSSSWTIHVIWVSIILSSFILCTFLSNMIWQSYVEDPTFTVVESTHYPMAEIAFPAVALCDSEMVYGPNTGSINTILHSRGYTIEQIDEFYKSINAIRHGNYVAPPYVPRMHFLLQDLGYSYNDLINMFKRPCEELLSICIWRSKAHNCSKMFRSVFTSAGYCCQFDIQYFSSRTKNMNMSYVSGVESGQALQVYINEQTISANGTVSSGRVKLYVFDHKDTITVIGSPVVVMTPATYYDIEIEVWAIDSSDNVKALTADVRQCLLSSDKGEGADFMKGCLSIFVLKQVVNRCHCLPFNYTAEELKVDYYTPCNWELMSCIYDSIEHKIHELPHFAHMSGCYERCDFVEYETEVRYVRERAMTHINNKYIGRLEVHFADSTCMKYRRQVIYTWEQMWANLGGIFGLCLGGSIISVIEFIWFISDLIFTVVKIVAMRSLIAKKRTQKVFSTNVPMAMKHSKSKRRMAFIN